MCLECSLDLDIMRDSARWTICGLAANEATVTSHGAAEFLRICGPYEEQIAGETMLWGHEVSYIWGTMDR